MERLIPIAPISPISKKKQWLGPLLLLLVAPVLLFPTHFPRLLVFIALVYLAIPLSLQQNQTGRWLRYTPANAPILVFAFLLLPLTLLISPLTWEVTWPRFTVLAWSLALFFAVVNVAPAEPRLNDPRLPRYLAGLTTLYLAAGAMAVLVGALGMRRVDKLFLAAVPAPLETLLGGFHPNELAGLITLFLPLTAALCLRSWRTRLATTSQFIIWLGLTLFLLGCLVVTQSRTSLVTAAISLMLVFLLSGRRGWIVLAAGIVGVIAALLLAGVERTADLFVYAGANSWASVIGPRMRIWEQALFALREFWPLGAGLGVFYTIAPHLYPQVPLSAAVQLPPAAADAHNLYLQTALDFGLPGLLLFLVIIALALVQLLRLLRHGNAHASVHGLSRAWVIGVLGALVAHLLYSLTDAVALGTPSGIALWFLLAMVMSTAADRPAIHANSAGLLERIHTWRRTLRLSPVTSLSLALAGVVIVLFVVWRFAFPNGHAARTTAVTLVASRLSPAEARVELATLDDSACRVNWYRGLLEDAAQDVSARNTSWGTLLDCAGEFIPFMAVLAAEDEALARQAIQKQPDSAVAYFWLAENVAAERPQAAIRAYQQGLELTPTDGVRWQALGDLLVERDPDTAIEAYLQSCYNGDPGANGCWRAGSTAEQQGDMTAAVAYYRLSKWETALQRADELEQQYGGSSQ